MHIASYSFSLNQKQAGKEDSRDSGDALTLNVISFFMS